MIPKSSNSSNCTANFFCKEYSNTKCVELGGTEECPALAKFEELRSSGELPATLSIEYAKLSCWKESQDGFWHNFFTYPTKEDCFCSECTRAPTE